MRDLRWYARPVPAAGLEETRAFYDEFFDHLLNDRLRLNPRHSVAARLIREHAPRGTSFLDLGCGIGLTSELARRRANEVVGVDLSPTLIQFARLTVRDVEFHAADIATIDLGRRFRTIALFDVYEHVPQSRRADLWENIERHLETGGRVVLTVPHPAATSEALVANQDALQIVDEVVIPAELLADALKVQLLPRALASYGIDRDPEYYWVVLERSRPPAPRRRSRWADPVQRLRVRLRARHYWRAANTIRER
jgi:SAM-dependent methyltransferase